MSDENQPITAALVAGMTDHTLLSPTATRSQVESAVATARELGVFGVCVPPTMLPLDPQLVGDLKVVTVVGFPSGVHIAGAKAMEAKVAVMKGNAQEIDMVVNPHFVADELWDQVEAEVRAVVRAVEPVPVKVIIESATLSDEKIVRVSHAAVAGGAAWVKTSTGFSPAGGASTHAVRLIRKAVPQWVGVKASGGIRTAEDARAMIEAGATRLGMSATEAVLKGL